MDATAGPRVVGRYLLYDAIASGGMATVHLGRLIGPVGFSRTVAIKRMHEMLARDPDYTAMFLDEARIVTRIRHPNVVPTLDVVALDSELLVVMEYVVGESLSLLLQRAKAAKNPPPVPVLIDIFVGVLNGLQAAHEATSENGEPLQVVHRDVSPQNILVGVDGIARMADFGVAKSSGRSHHTRDGQVKGKLQYMAPEQLRGKPVTPATDVFAVSIVLWEALTGEDPFAGESEAELVYNVLESNAEPPSRLRPDVPKALDDIVLQGLSKNPAERFINAKAMAAALESAVPPVSSSSVGKWVRECAREDIERKALQLARVERDISCALSIPDIELPLHSARDTPTTRGPAFAMAHTTPPPPLPARRRVLIIGAGAAFVVGVVALLLLATSSPKQGETGRGFPISASEGPATRATSMPSTSAPPAPEALAASASSAPALASPPKPTTKPRPPKGDQTDRIYRRE